MEDRIPAALKWLIDKRARIQGEILKRNGQNELVFSSHQKTLDRLYDDLCAIDRVIGFHEVPVDPNDISPIRTRKCKYKLPYGKTTRLVFEFFGQSDKEYSSTIEILEFAATKLDISETLNKNEYQALYFSLRKRLCDLRTLGKIKDKKRKNTHEIKFWASNV